MWIDSCLICLLPGDSTIFHFNKLRLQLNRNSLHSLRDSIKQLKIAISSCFHFNSRHDDYRYFPLLDALFRLIEIQIYSHTRKIEERIIPFHCYSLIATLYISIFLFVFFISFFLFLEMHGRYQFHGQQKSAI